MTVPADNDIRLSYTGSGTTGPFTTPYFLANEDILAKKVLIEDGTETTLALNTDYTLSGAGESAGGSLTLTASLSSSYKLVIINNAVDSQTAEYPRNDPFPSQTHQEVVDRRTMVSQRLADQIERALRLTDGDVTGIDMTLPAATAAARGDKVIGINSAGTAIELKGAVDNTLLAAQLASTETGNGAALVGFKQSGIATSDHQASRTVNAKLAEVQLSITDAKNSDGTAVSTSASDNASGINRAAAALDAAGGGDLYIPRGTWSFGSVLNIPGTVALKMDSGALLNYTGTGPAIKLNYNGATGPTTSTKKKHVIRVKRATLQWNDGSTDTTSVGIQVINVNNSIIEVLECQNFHKNIELLGDGTGVTDNTFIIGDVRNARYNVYFSTANGGWVNQNTFIGGKLRVDSDYMNLAAAPTTLVFLGSSNNANVFLGVNMEGGQTLPSKVVDLNGDYNEFIGCRYEGNGAGTFHIQSTAQFNKVIGGYSNLGPDSDLFDIDNFSNTIIGGLGAMFPGDGGIFGGAGVVGIATNASGDPVIQARNTSGAVFFEVAGSGDTKFYDGAGKKDATTNPSGVDHPSVLIRATEGALAFGLPTQAPTNFLQPASTTILDALNWILRVSTSSRLLFQATTLASGATSIACNGGNYYKTNNAGATNVVGVSNGIDGQVIYLRAGDANTTLKHSASFVMKSGADVVMTNGEVRQFLVTGTGTAVEI